MRFCYDNATRFTDYTNDKETQEPRRRPRHAGNTTQVPVVSMMDLAAALALSNRNRDHLV
jgi:hypothetical protein